MDRMAINPPFRPDQTLQSARDELRDMATTREGARCPCCTRKVKVYSRTLNSVAARALVALYHEHATAFGSITDVTRTHLADVAHQGGQLVLSHHWGLMIEEARQRPDGGRTGWWKVTPKGVAWLTGQITVDRYAHIYDGRCLSLSGQQITVQDALGDGFDFGHLMRRVADTAPGADPFTPDQPAADAA